MEQEVFRIYGDSTFGSLIPHVVCSTMFLLETEGITYAIPFNNPTAIAVGAVGGRKLESVTRLDSFVEAGGVCTVVRVLRESNCPITLFHAAVLIRRLLEPGFDPVAEPDGCSWAPVSERRGRSFELADQLFHSGE
jgi:hypothetical protein